MKVAIVGAGISGLLACKYILSKGFSPIVFESGKNIGGVWTRTLATTKLQTTRKLYQFSDFPWPSSVAGTFPNHHQVIEYLQAYANEFDLLRHIRFRRKVISIEYIGQSSDEEMQNWSLWGGTGELFNPKGKWIVTAHDTQKLCIEVHEVNFVVLCLGKFSDVPNIPQFPPGMGPEEFDGMVIHSMDYSNMDDNAALEFVKGKKVYVVGFQKTALDIAMECSTANGVESPCTVLYRTKHWNVPDYIPWGIPIGYLYLNRFSELLVHKPGEGLLLNLLATFLSPLRWGISKFVETHIKKKLKLEKFDMVPTDHSFLNTINSCTISIVPDGFYDRVDIGSIILKKATNFGFCKDGITIVSIDDHDGTTSSCSSTETLKVDVVILATGFNGIDKVKDVFLSPMFQDYISASENSTVPLYRECIHPRIPHLAIIGFSESLSNLYTSEMRCRWLAELLDGKFKLPSIKEMEKDVAEWEKYKKRYAGNKIYNGRSCIGALHIWYNDQLCKDMGWNPKRKNGFLAELFEPYGPLDYINP